MRKNIYSHEEGEQNMTSLTILNFHAALLFLTPILNFAANEKVMNPTGWFKARSDTITLAHRIPVPKGYKPQKDFAPRNC